LLRDVPWGHITHLLDQVNDPDAHAWHVRAAIEHGWSRSILVHEIERNLDALPGARCRCRNRISPSSQYRLEVGHQDFYPDPPIVNVEPIEFRVKGGGRAPMLRL
jgi:hypothetical protein